MPNHRLKKSMQCTQDHAIICKFMGIWAREVDILRWIQIKWQLKAPFNLYLLAKGFFTVIFEDLEDRKHILHNGPYFMNSVGLFVCHWEPCYNPEKEQFLVAPIWVCLYSLPQDLLEMDILESIDNSSGEFFKSQTSLGVGNSPPMPAFLCI